LGKHAEALADLVKAVELRPDEASYRGLRGAAQLALGKHAEGRTDLLKAIQLNRGDAGAAYKPDAKGELSPEALKHGEEQVRRLLADRPPLAEHAEAAAVFRQWAARKFAGEDIGETIDWDPTPPTDSDAENYSPIPGQRGRILVDLNYQHGPKKGQPRTFEELWSRVIFELHNIAYARQFVKLNNDAAAQKITKEQFVYGIWKHEHQAMQLTRAFYAQVFLPWAEKQKLATDPELWFALQWDEVDEAMVGFMDRSAYPWRPYGRQYDWWTVRNLHQDGKLKRALRLLEEMSAEEQHPLDLAEVYLWIGRCQLESDRAEQAVKALTEAIRLNGRLAAAYEFRGAAQKKLGREAEAEADLAKARQLAPEEKR
jgi:tetratricopeptide (TPR) repeat protein